MIVVVALYFSSSFSFLYVFIFIFFSLLFAAMKRNSFESIVMEIIHRVYTRQWHTHKGDGSTTEKKSNLILLHVENRIFQWENISTYNVFVSIVWIIFYINPLTVPMHTVSMWQLFFFLSFFILFCTEKHFFLSSSHRNIFTKKNNK